MLGLALRLLQWNVLRNRGQTLIMVLAVFGSLSSYVLLGTALTEMSGAVAQTMRSEWPFDLTVTGSITPEVWASVENTKGMQHIETVTTAEAYFFSQLHDVIGRPTGDTKLVMELAAGELPESDQEIAIPEELTLALQLELGDEVMLLPNRSWATPLAYRISGILSSKSGVLRRILLTDDGVSRLWSENEQRQSLLVQLDGRANLNNIAQGITRVFPTLSIKTMVDEYERAQQSLTMSDSLVQGLRGLILVITVSSLAVLFYLSQRSGAYQTGVLRAIGVKRPWLLVAPLLQSAIIFGIGFLLTGWLLPMVSVRMGLESTPAELMVSLRRDMVVYLVVGLLSTLVVNGQWLGLPVPRLLKDAW